MADEVSVCSRVESFCLRKKCTDQVIEHYDQWAKNGMYDKDMSAIKFIGPAISAETIAEHYPENRSKVQILDIAAGTGQVGLELRKVGFTQIDALEPSQAMLDAAKERDIYRKYFCTVIDGKELAIPEASYDVITCVGGVADGHIPADAIWEMFRLIKKGGLILLLGNAGVWQLLPEYTDKMMGYIKSLEKDRKLTVLREEICENYRFATEKDKSQGILILLKKL